MVEALPTEPEHAGRQGPEPSPSTTHGRRPAWISWSVAALVAALAALLTRYAFVAHDSLAYDEATYVELAQHPWHSNFYPDQFFLRHPPLYFLILGAWETVAGADEALVRLPSLVFAAAAIVFGWSALRRLGGATAATWGTLFLGSSFLTLVYATQATMYPLGFFLASLGLWARVHARAGLERTAILLLALTHLFGFVFVALWLRDRPKGQRLKQAVRLWPAFAWLGVASAAAAADFLQSERTEGPMLGPLWQGLRFAESLVDGRATAHVVAFFLALLLLNPLLLRAAWKVRRAWAPWALAGALLLLAFLPGPGHLRYGLLLLPLVVLIGVPELVRKRPWPKAAYVALAAAILAPAAGAVFLRASLDPNAGNDVPGSADWQEAASLVAQFGADRVATPVSTSLAYYLIRDHAMTVADASQGPLTLVLASPTGATVEVYGANTADLVRRAGEDGYLMAIPTPWTDALADHWRYGYARCGSFAGGDFLMRESGDASACPTAAA